VAYAVKYRGEDAVVGCWFGDGATSEGDWHEGLNFSGIHKLPLVWYCENNRYAISVPLSKQMAVKDVAVRAEGYGFEGVVVDGNDVLACYEASREALEKARNGGGPTLIEMKTYRFHPHTSDDDDRTYRTREEVEEWRKKDPIPRFEDYLKGADVLDEAGLEETREKAKEEVAEGVKQAQEAEFPDPSRGADNVFAERLEV
jgi:2-oxoisovalerate dehydrogenase E1 component alpha subunit